MATTIALSQVFWRVSGEAIGFSDHVLPRPTMSRPANSSNRYTKLSGKSGYAKRALAYLSDHFLIQNRASMFFAAPCAGGSPQASRFRLPVLAPHVRHVVGVRSYEQMFGVYAPRVVAEVANKQPRWYFGSSNNKGRSVRADMSAAFFANADSSVSVRVSVSSPRPTFVIAPAINLGPKSYFKWLCHALTIMGNRLQRQGSVPHL